MGMSGCVGMVNTGAPAGCRCAECPRGALAHKPHKRSKMNVLKNIKKKMGIGRAACVGGTGGGVQHHGHHAPPLTFHAAHGDNVRLSRDTTTARRVESFCKGVAFSARPVAVNEKVCIRFSEMSTNWSGVLRFGFTGQDPALLAGQLPKYACPDLTNKPGHWAKALAERLCERGAVLAYHVTQAGDVHFSVDGDDKGVFFCGVDTKGPLWALLDIYGNCTGVQFVDSRTHLNNMRREEVDRPVPAADEESVDSLIVALQAANITNSTSEAWRPAGFHRTCGRHIRFGPEPGIATRFATEFCQGYVFTARPLAPGERLLIRVLETERSYAGALALGLTSCDPSKLSQRDLPDDSDMLLDRPEYWVVSKDVAGSLRAGEDLVLSVTASGEVKVSVNGGPAATVMYVDHSLRLWAFLDLFGGTRRVQVLSRPPPAVLVVALPPALGAGGVPPIAQSVISCASSTASLPTNAPLSPPPSLVNQRNHQVSTSSIHHQVLPRASSAGAIQLMPVMSSQSSIYASNQSNQMCNQSNQMANQSNQMSNQSNQMANQSNQMCNQSNQMANQSNQMSNQSNQSSQMCNQSNQMVNQSNAANHTASQLIGHANHPPATSQSIVLVSTPSSSLISGNVSSVSSLMNPMLSGNAMGECTICYERQIDSVLYTCGHMCMCYRCAVQQWRGKGGGQCPMCRAPIRDVIRTYKS